MVLVEVNTHSSHVLAVADEFLDIILDIDCVVFDLRLTISIVIIFDKGNFSSCMIIIKILELVGWPSIL